MQQIIEEDNITIDLFPVYDALLEWALQKSTRSDEEGCSV